MHKQIEPIPNKPSVPRKRRTMLAPAAYSETMMPALRLARASRWTRKIANVLLIVLVLTVFLLAFVPWQQNVAGSGSVLAFAPDQRQQVIEAPIKGRVVRWGENIVENALVQKGQFIAEISDLDESYSARLEQQLVNSQLTADAAGRQLDANERALTAAKTIVNSYEAQVRAYEKVKEETIAAQDAYVDMAREKVRAEKQQLLEYEAAIPQLQAEQARVRRLEAEGNVSLQKLQEVERKLQEAEAKVNRAEAYVSSAEAELAGKLRERTAKIEKAQVDIDYAEALLQKANGDVSKAESDIAKSEQEQQKAGKAVLDMETKVARQQNQMIMAPFAGYIVQIQPNMKTAVVKEGDPICTIVPETSDRSVQIWMNGNDAPLVEPGRHVRLQFEGWPALQFSGWPSVAVGTFGGEVVSVDATDNGMGKFRVLVRPAQDSPPWPQDRFLRQGVRANGWVLLDQVPLWYEVWRRLNGFPPVVSVDAPKDGKSKAPKIPKP
ncbi:MAG: HlyD family secretion protein [Rubinisphaera brasiliensis]|uniref:HlyD family secretion protein n=1 Tax=Rubinisphaera brasiliensis TaxID=119 RepID=UPI00391C43F2|nr:HlyD family efflux transporter periplasmic adaptor subunit [bacterium]